MHNHRENENEGGKQDRLQTERLINLVTKHGLVQEVDQPTHACEVLDLIFSNETDLVSSVKVEDWPAFTDHRVVIATTTYTLGRAEPIMDEVHLLESGRRMKQLNFNKASWPEIKTELGTIDWTPMP